VLIELSLIRLVDLRSARRERSREPFRRFQQRQERLDGYELSVSTGQSNPREQQAYTDPFGVFTPFRDTIEEEETRIRRYGAGVFVAGILFQIVGILYDTILFRSILCYSPR